MRVCSAKQMLWISTLTYFCFWQYFWKNFSYFLHIKELVTNLTKAWKCWEKKLCPSWFNWLTKVWKEQWFNFKIDAGIHSEINSLILHNHWPVLCSINNCFKQKATSYLKLSNNVTWNREIVFAGDYTIRLTDYHLH